MCWVMPPASPATTSAPRIASSSEVLPWSTWPMMVTTGGRVLRLSRASWSSPGPVRHWASAGPRAAAGVGVAHDGDHRGAGLGALGRVLVVAVADFDIAFADALDAVAELGD